ncbi:unnamed protein product [Tuber aestivum]|uniref:Uncharacterized protein n=1 Tax=Tuber aestivum TaxID=59557 RepID=A0A292PT92_9PEZI|nr:unnamed protein product [Tuber aestivum]
MNAGRIIYARWLSVAIPFVYFLLWSTAFSTAYPGLRRRNYPHLAEPSAIREPKDSETPPHKPHKFKGPLWCDGPITAGPTADREAYVCEGQTLCKGATGCDGPLTCTGSWFDDEGMLACRGDLLCDGALSCNEITPAACLPGLRGMPDWALGLLLGFLILISGAITGCTAAVMQGALDLENKVARDIMKPIPDVKMLDVKDRMNIGRWKKVINWGYSRIPVYSSIEENRRADSPYQDCPIKIWGYLHCFVELAVLIAIVEKGPPIEPKTQDNTPANNAPPNRVCEGIRDGIFKKLKFIRNEGDYQQPLTQTPKYWTDSPIYKLSREQPLGIVTMEDVLKALLRSPIFDEKDITHYRRRMGHGSGSPERVFESELQSPFARESLNSDELEVESELPAGLAIQLNTKNGGNGSDIASRKEHNSGDKHLSFSKPLVPISSRERRRNALTDPLGGTPRCNSPEGLSSKDKGKGKAFEVRKAMSENNYSTNASDGFELESLTGVSIPSSIFSHSTSTTSHLVDLLGLRGEYTNSSGPGPPTLDEEFPVPVHST